VSDLAANATWTSLRAVRDGTAYVMDGNAYVNRPGPRLIDSAERFAWAFDDAARRADALPMPDGIERIG
jgi:iron complex transport system substrate-binding protein